MVIVLRHVTGKVLDNKFKINYLHVAKKINRAGLAIIF